MPKNIALFIDGTWNKPKGQAHPENTNVRKLYKFCVNDNQQQFTHYLNGVGTEGPMPPISSYPSFSLKLRALFWRSTSYLPKKVRSWFDGATGRGTSSRITDAYEFLCQHYELGDRIYLFGFSRGAFAARSLAGFIDAIGILLSHRLEYVEAAYALYRNGEDRDQTALREYLQKLTDFAHPESDSTLPVYFIGVWDTVAALGLPGRMRILTDPFNENHQTELPENVTHARHALAIHELRKEFSPLLWEGTNSNNPRQSLKQVWFTGAHADVGGGYKDHDLSDKALEWMARESQQHGLVLTQFPSVPDDLSIDAKLHHEIRNVFVGMTPTPRTELEGPPKILDRTMQTFLIHHTTYKRLSKWHPVNYRFRRPGVNKALNSSDTRTCMLQNELLMYHGRFPEYP